MKSDGFPAVSVVVAVREAGPALETCLQSLERQNLRRSIEIIVAGGPVETARSAAARYPAVRFLPFGERLGTPQLTKRALEQARGPVVVVTDPHCVFPPDWLEKLCRAHESEFAVIGGTVDYGGPDTLVGWTCYLADYGAFMPPERRRVTSLLAGNHVSYKRSVVQNSLGSMQEGYWKFFFHGDLERQGIGFLLDPELVVYCVQSETCWRFAGRYYLNALQFAAMRAQRMSLPARLLHLMTAPALPPLLLYRRLRAVWKKKRNRARILLAIPLLAVFVTSWSAGELAGYLLGSRVLRR
jgi:glycosyltransferase involved in cell wall biosynthesis